eukprot:Skav201460  [mRNA]  locus=scaffold6:394122:397486:+ [translate_table: standard]
MSSLAHATLTGGKVSVTWGCLFEMSNAIRGSSEVKSILSGDDMRINWSDGLQSCYDWKWLARQVKPKELPRCLWDANFQEKVPWISYDTMTKLQLCSYLHRYGLAFVRGVGAHEGTIRKFGNEIGHIRVTNYGDVFDVKDEGVNATNLAFTNQYIPAHTDNPYRDPFPGVQLLHCLSCATEGGATLFTDGFHAAVLLRASVPVLQLQNGEIQRVTFNNRSAAPLPHDLPQLERYYEAWAIFDELANSGEFTVRIHLKPGDLAIWSNGRVMHGREAYERGAPRHLQGSYLDYDEIQSTVTSALVEGEDLERFF